MIKEILIVVVLALIALPIVEAAGYSNYHSSQLDRAGYYYNNVPEYNRYVHNQYRSSNYNSNRYYPYASRYYPQRVTGDFYRDTQRPGYGQPVQYSYYSASYNYEDSKWSLQYRYHNTNSHYHIYRYHQ